MIECVVIVIGEKSFDVRPESRECRADRRLFLHVLARVRRQLAETECLRKGLDITMAKLIERSLRIVDETELRTGLQRVDRWPLRVWRSRHLELGLDTKLFLRSHPCAWAQRAG